MATMFSEPQEVIAALKSRLPGASDDQLVFELGLAAQEFFRETACWTETVTVALVEGQAEYSLPGVGSGVPCGFIYVRRTDGTYYAPTPVGAVTASYTRFEVDASMQGIKLFPTPMNLADGDSITVCMIMTLGDVVGAGGSPVILLPAAQLVAHKQAFIEGTMANMMSHPMKPYTSPRMAAFYFRRFRFHMTRAKRAAMTGYTKAEVPWLFPNPAGRRGTPTTFPTGS